MIRRLCAQCFTRSNGQLDVSRLVMLLMALAYIVESSYSLVHGQRFDWQAFGVGAGAIMAGGGAGVMLHGKSQ